MIATRERATFERYAAVFRAADLARAPDLPAARPAADRWEERYAEVMARAEAAPALLGRYFPGTPTADLRAMLLAGDGWACIAGARINPTSRKRWCYLETWHAPDAVAFGAMIDAVRDRWSAPYDAIKMHASPDADAPRGATPQTYAVCGDLRASPPPAAAAPAEAAGPLTAWWDAFTSFSDVETDPDAREEERRHMARLVDAGTVLNLIDDRGVAGHVSWEPSAYDDLLIEDCWHINHIAVRPDRRGTGLAGALLAAAADAMDLDRRPVVCALVRAGNDASLRAFAKANMPVKLAYHLL